MKNLDWILISFLLLILIVSVGFAVANTYGWTIDVCLQGIRNAGTQP